MPPTDLATGYEISALALAFVCVYFVFLAGTLRAFPKHSVLVARYDPPAGASPAVASWLFERGRLPRALAAALVSMAAKSYLAIDQTGDLYSVRRLGPDVCLALTPEEDALARTLFATYDCFDFDSPSPELDRALQAFRWALSDTTYFSRHFALYVPAWIASGLGIACALVQGRYHFPFRGYGVYALLLAFSCLIIALRTLGGTIEKVAARLPGSTAPLRPWNGTDSLNLTLTAAGLTGAAFLALASTASAAFLITALVVVNAVFFYALQGPSVAGRKLMTELAGYKKFLAEVHADVLSRTNSTQVPPSQLTETQSYAIAFHLDIGWGEQFVASIASLLESSQIFGDVQRFSRWERQT